MIGTAALSPAGNRVVVVRLQGGIGNQLFEYAAGRFVAERDGATLFVQRPSESGINLFDVLPAAQCVEAAAHLRRRFRVSEPGDPPWRRLVNAALREVPWQRARYGVVREGFGGDVRVPSDVTARNSMLIGWFIDVAWFGSTVGAVGEMLLQRLAAHPAYALAHDATVVSFRRGDFVRWGLALASDYYENAVAALRHREGPCFVVGDDDMFCDFACDWLRSRGLDAQRRPDLSGSTGLTDLALIAGAQQVIMSNSTFCWWATTAGDRASRDGRVVIAPDPWNKMREREGDTRDDVGAVPDQWIRVAASFTSGPA